MKPMLACDWVESKLKFPVLAQPKIDGVRGMNFLGRLTGRSLKEHGNKFTTELFSNRYFQGLDGELAAQSETHPDLCRLTTSAMSSYEGTPFILWHVFDLINDHTIQLPYTARHDSLRRHVDKIQELDAALGCRLRVVEYKKINDAEELLLADTLWLAAGYEGTILRDPNGKYRQGRSTPREGGLLRIKRFIEEEAIVTGVSEGQTNMNEAKIGLNGYTERSSHQDNMVPNGMVGTIHCLDIKTGKQIDVAPGRMLHKEREHYLQFRSSLIGKTIKYKRFNHGTKDKPRFPTFQCIKASSDIG